MARSLLLFSIIVIAAHSAIIPNGSEGGITAILNQIDDVFKKLTNPADLYRFAVCCQELLLQSGPFVNRALPLRHVFRNPHYDPDYALHFEQAIQILNVNGYLRAIITPQDIASAYDRLKVDAGTDSDKIEKNDRMMDELIGLLDVVDLTELLHGLRLSDKEMDEDERRLAIQDRIEQLRTRLHFPETFYEIAAHLHEDYQVLAILDKFSDETAFQTVLALAQCGHRLDLKMFLWSERVHVAEMFPLLRDSFLDGEKLGQGPHHEIQDCIELGPRPPQLVSNPHVFAHLCKYATRFANDTYTCMEFVKMVFESDHPAKERIFNARNNDKDTFLHRMVRLKYDRNIKTALEWLQNIPKIDFDARDKDGNTAADIARNNGQNDIAKLYKAPKQSDSESGQSTQSA